MRAIVVTQPGGPEMMQIGEVPTPEAGPGELLVRIRAAGVNRADLSQRQGNYPPPPGASTIMGMEVAGEIAALGAGVADWRIGERVMALLGGGGYAEYVTVPAALAMRVPDNVSWEEAGGIPEAFLTAYLALFPLGDLTAGQAVLVHAGASGVGIAGIQLAREAGARVVATAGTDAKVAAVEALGAIGVNYRTQDFAAVVAERTDGKGANVILDFIGIDHWERNLAALAMDGRIIVISSLSGGEVPMNLGALMRKRAQVIGTTLRNRPLAQKVALTRALAEFALPRFADGRMKVVVDTIYPLADAADAHRRMADNANTGKLILRVD